MCTIINPLIPLLIEYVLLFWCLRNLDGTHENAPPKGDNTDDIENVITTFANVLNIGDNPDMPSSASNLSSKQEEVMVDNGFVKIPSEMDNSESNDNR